MKGLAVDLVILNERSSSYVQDLQIALETLVRANQSRPQIGEEKPAGHIFMLRRLRRARCCFRRLGRCWWASAAAWRTNWSGPLI